MKYRSIWLPLSMIVALTPVTARSETAISSPAAHALVALMEARHVDALATRDLTHPGRFIAALLYPNAELLVVSAQYSAPEYLQSLIDQRKFRDVYTDLQAGQNVSDQVFVVDMMADGLRGDGSSAADVMYEPGNKQTVFDDSWRRAHNLDQRAYEQMVDRADRLYGAMLDQLTAGLEVQ